MKRGMPRYSSMREVLRGDHSAEASLITMVTTMLNAHSRIGDAGLLLAPLGFGKHVDHCIAREAALRGNLSRAGGAVLAFYEDMPYSIDLPAGPETRTSAAKEQAIVSVTHAEWSIKLAAISAYESQKAMLNQRGVLASRISNYALDIGGGQLAERVWISSQS